MEGNNYAGGWGKRTADITSLGDAHRYSNIESIQPIYIEIGEPLEADIIKQAVDDRVHQIKNRKKVDKVIMLEQQLREVKSSINKP